MQSFFRISIIGMVLLGIGCFLSGFAQDVKVDIQKINEAYSGHKSFRADLVYSLYASHADEVPHQTLKGVVQNQGSHQYSRMSDMETMINDQYALIINHERQTISLQPKFDRSSQIMQPVALDSLTKICKDIQYQVLAGQHVAYDFYFDAYSYERIRVVFDPENYVIQKFVFYQKDPVELAPGQTPQAIRMEIAFKNIQINRSYPSNTFSEKKYVRKVGENFQPATTYASYELVNFLPKN